MFCVLLCLQKLQLLPKSCMRSVPFATATCFLSPNRRSMLPAGVDKAVYHWQIHRHRHQHHQSLQLRLWLKALPPLERFQTNFAPTPNAPGSFTRAVWSTGFRRCPPLEHPSGRCLAHALTVTSRCQCSFDEHYCSLIRPNLFIWPGTC